MSDYVACTREPLQSRVGSFLPRSKRHEKAIPPFGVSRLADRLGCCPIGDSHHRDNAEFFAVVLSVVQRTVSAPVHFSPPIQFMNDPNGLVYFNGAYQLYYQYNPLQLVAGNQSWGHALSTDLIHWKNANPLIAIPEALTGPLAGQIFTGSAVVDSNNTSGFFTGHPGQALVAIYTLNQPTREVQNIAYSLDNGLTYTDYSGNPVLNSPTGDNPNFRDPKVFFYAPTNSWIMSVALPRAHQVLIYRSPDLIHWGPLPVSTFGPAGIDGYQWECPNLFPVPVQGTNQQKWVLMVGVNPGAPQGGSMDEYFVGNFDGT